MRWNYFAAGYGKRLLISGVHRLNAASDISLACCPTTQASPLRCCVDLDCLLVNTRSNAAERGAPRKSAASSR
jgi:hypothetical protein